MVLFPAQILLWLSVSAHAAAPTSMSAATAPPPPLQRCSMSATLSGDLRFYLRYGRDSWNGSAAMTCTTPTDTHSRQMMISFNSTALATGVNADSQFELHVNLLTTTPLDELRIFGPVAAKTQIVPISWVLASANVQADIQVTTDNPAIENSLLRGSLLIR